MARWTWEQVLYERLKDCRALVVLCSPHWQQSKWCFAELVYAKMASKEVIPVVLADCKLDVHLGIGFVSKRAVKHSKKMRTREHVLADLSVNYVERQVLQRGWSVDRFEHDYGIDLFMSTYSETGEIENGRVLLQVKATDHLRLLKDGKTISFALSRRDLRHWLPEPAPVILVMYDGTNDEAYWLYVQRYFETERPIDLATAPGQVTVHIPEANRLDAPALDQFARFRDDLLAQLDGKIHHG